METLSGTCKVVKAFVLGESARGGRTAFDRDRVTAAISAGAIVVENGKPVADGGPTWRELPVSPDGVYAERELRGGYAALIVSSDTEQTVVVRASGHGVFYAPDVVHGGDPYGTDAFHFPVRLKRGENQFLFSVGRGRLAVRFEAASNTAFISGNDLTIGDIVPRSTDAVYAGVQVVNPGSASYFMLMATIEPRSSASHIVYLPSMSSTKIPVKLPTAERLSGDTVPVTFELVDCGSVRASSVKRMAMENSSKIVSTVKVSTRVRHPQDTRKNTFISDTDGSVQYYGVRPAQSRTQVPNMVLTLHGASVEGMGQAEAYGNHADISWIAATNRRPYGFDWEDWGRKDAMEVLADASSRFPMHPAKVHLAGHSMGGHGTWVNGSLYPSTFASIAPSAGWVSFASYGGGARTPQQPDAIDVVFTRANNEYDTLKRAGNLDYPSVFILHGDADDNVPVSEARTMKSVLENRRHPRFGYHEQPGAGHWWDGPQGAGADCLDWPGITAAIKSSTVADPDTFSFSTPHPGVSSNAFWLQIVQQLVWGEMSKVSGTWKASPAEIWITTENVERISISDRSGKKRPTALKINGQSLQISQSGSVDLRLTGSKWCVEVDKPLGQKTPQRSGPFKNAIGNRFALVIPTGGTPAENDLALQIARYHLETWMVRGNGHCDILLDTDALDENRTYVLYGNRSINKAWHRMVNQQNVDVTQTTARVGSRSVKGQDVFLLACQPHPKSESSHVVLVGFTGPVAARAVLRVPLFVSGVAMPDWTLAKANVFQLGRAGVIGAGYFDSAWKPAMGQSAWR
jgi:dienelactone hydrolase